MISVIAVFDIGKTNKKFFLLDQQYKIVFEQSIQFEEVVDEDGESCDDVHALSTWVTNTLAKAVSSKDFDVKAVNFSAYGASFVHINAKGLPVTPLYNYLKPYQEVLKQKFYNSYGGEAKISLETASPILGNLNSGMQLYWLKYDKPNVYAGITYSLHLPQYMSYLISQKAFCDITSIGCHTQLWNFQQKNYHQWVKSENIIDKLPILFPSDIALDTLFENKQLTTGIGLHDSSAALIPYLSTFEEPFILISTGTWCISLNPFNNEPLTIEELKQDCLCYMDFKGNSVKASRLFAGHEHEVQTKRLASHFNTSVDYYKRVKYNDALVSIEKEYLPFSEKELTQFNSYDTAYHNLISNIIFQQKKSTSLVLGRNSVKRIFVDGGFSKNDVYMNMLAKAFPFIEVYAASVSQASSIGAAIAIHNSWNTTTLPDNLVELKKYH